MASEIEISQESTPIESVDFFYEAKVEDENVTELIQNAHYGLKADGEMVHKAAVAIGKIGKKAIPILIQTLDTFAEEARLATELRIGISQALVPESYLKQTISAIHVDEEIKKRLRLGYTNPCYPPALALVMIGQDSVDPLLEYLEEGNDWIARLAAIWALGEIGDLRALPYLKKLIRLFGFDLLSKTARTAVRTIKKRN